MFRNKQKRLFIGIGAELLLKAYYLKSGFYINKINDKNNKGKNAFKFSEIPVKDVSHYDTITFNYLIQGLKELDYKLNGSKKNNNKGEINKSLLISKVYRNKEAHIITKKHKYNEKNYDEIEKGIKLMYKEWFDEKLEFQISFENNENGKFEIIK